MTGTVPAPQRRAGAPQIPPWWDQGRLSPALALPGSAWAAQSWLSWHSSALRSGQGWSNQSRAFPGRKGSSPKPREWGNSSDASKGLFQWDTELGRALSPQDHPGSAGPGGDSFDAPVIAPMLYNPLHTAGFASEGTVMPPRGLWLCLGMCCGHTEPEDRVQPADSTAPFLFLGCFCSSLFPKCFTWVFLQ